MSYPNNIIEAFGGIRATARATGFNVSTVTSWKVRGAIRDEHKPRILEASKEVGAGLSEIDFFPKQPVSLPQG